jgi:PAS domain S-box-containing protein
LEAINQELRKEIEERQLIENQLRLQMTAVRAAANGIVITDRQGLIQWCNPAFTHMTGYTAEEVAGQTLRILNSGQQAAEFYAQLWATILAGEVWRGELTNRRKDGRLYVEEQTIAPVLNEQREITHFVAVKQDVTERKQAEDRLERYNQDLLALSKAERAQRQLAETLTAANQALTQSLNLETVLETLLDFVARLVPYDSANVMLLEAESRLAVRVTRGYERWSNPEWVRAITFDAQTTPVLNTLLTTRCSALVPDTRLEPSWQTPPGVEHVRSWLGVPLTAGGNVIGLYSLDKTEPGFFTTEHVRMAEMLVGQAAVAIQNAWLFEQVRAGRERLQSLSRRLVEVQEAERLYVARELHDEAGQSLTSLLFKLGQLEQQTTDPRQADQLAELKQMTNSVLESLHRLAMDLRPASLDHLGLVPALLQYVKAIGDRFGIIAQFKAVGIESERLAADVETALYRIVQEALTNIVRHAHAARADVLMERRGDRVIVVIEDDGLGFDADAARFAQQGHLGLVGMQERAEMLGGSLVIESAVGTGTTVVVEVPYDHSYFDR